MARAPSHGPPLPEEFFRHYGETGYEASRLQRGRSCLERVRTQEIVTRFLPPPPAVVFDVGGGAGFYAFWLADMGYETHLVDVHPLHVELAGKTQETRGAPLASIRRGDARTLDFEDGAGDVSLFFGPLYHLTEREARLSALREAYRVLRPGGLLFAAGISRFTSTLDGLIQDFLADPEFVTIVQRDLADGQHRNPMERPEYFTTAYLHRPEELKEEMEDAGFRHERTLPVEGPGWLLQNFDEHWEDEGKRNRLLNAVRSLEDEPSLLGASAHLIAVAQKEA
ncbi:MAG: class I SAM-dependent methyltransferase [Planctomycetota bacterium]